MKNIKQLLLLLFIPLSLHAYEHITLFQSDITIANNSTILVQETIDVVSEGYQIKRGIVREIPTEYRMWGFFNFNVEFRIKSVVRDGKEISYWTEHASNGIKIYMAKKDSFISLGKHRYVLTYETTRQIGFFEKHDEFYWNVTGNGWRLPINKVIARLHIPNKIPMNAIELWGYTGYQGDKKSNCCYEIEDNVITFVTTKNLYSGEGLTIAVGMPKGYIADLSFPDKIQLFIKDNIVVLFVLLLLFLLLSIMLFFFITIHFKNKSYQITPLFHPPKDMMPSTVGFIASMEFKQTFLSADIIHLAMRDLITIKKDVFKYGYIFWSTYYVLFNISHEGKKVISNYDAALLKSLFKGKNKIVLINNTITKTLDVCEKYNQKKCNTYVRRLGAFWPIAIGIGIVITFVLSIFYDQLELVFISLIVLTVYFFFIESAKLYTQEGKQLKEEVDGFKLYLMTAEVHRLQFITEPPKLTPKLYEKYLSYAMVLGVEKLWTKKFEKLFKDLEIKGTPYSFHGGIGRDLGNSSFVNSFSSSISSASSTPGSSSGSGGGGSSGGGGGGGGGGGC